MLTLFLQRVKYSFSANKSKEPTLTDLFNSSCFSYSCFTLFAFTFVVQVSFKGSTSLECQSSRILVCNEILDYQYCCHWCTCPVSGEQHQGTAGTPCNGLCTVTFVTCAQEDRHSDIEHGQHQMRGGHLATIRYVSILMS